jgi:TonB family protein
MQKERKDKSFIRRPTYPGGPKAMQEFLRQNLRYPEDAFKKGVEGTVSIRYEIDYKGNVTNVEVLTSVGHGCDEEAVRLAKLLKFDVPPTRKLKVTFHNTLKVHFRIQKNAVAAAPAVSAPPQVVYNYVATPPEPAKEEPAKTPSAGGGYTFTITIG